MVHPVGEEPPVNQSYAGVSSLGDHLEWNGVAVHIQKLAAVEGHFVSSSAWMIARLASHSARAREGCHLAM